MKPSLYLHVGIHKTGTTFLQREVFPILWGKNFLGKPDFGILSGDKPTSLSRFMDVSPLVWKDIGGLFLNKVRENSAPYADVILSDEHAVEANDPAKIARHLHEIKKVFSSVYDLGVLIVIRRQDTWFSSAYAQMSNRYDKASQSHFEQWVKDRINKKAKFFSSAGVRLKYYTLIKKIQNKIGNKCVRVLPYEMMKLDPILFVKKVCNFVGCDVPSSISISPVNKRSPTESEWELRPQSSGYIQLRPGRVFQAVFGRSRIPITNWKRGEKIVLTKSLSEKILKKYEKENKKLEQKLDLGLKDYGYC